MENYETIKQLLSDYGFVGLLIILLLWVLFLPDSAKQVTGWIYQFLGWIFMSFRKRAIKIRIENSCDKSIKKVAQELPELDIPNLSINWVKGESLDTIFKEGKAIVKMKFSSDQTQNIIRATAVFVRDAFLKHSKPYLNPVFRRAIDFSVTRKLLLHQHSNRKNIVSQYLEENISELESIRENCTMIEEIEDNGLFTRILIRELDSFGTRLFGRTPTVEHSVEADNFLKFLYDIAIREPDDVTTLSYPKTTIKVAVILIAKLETYTQHGLDAYLRRIKLGIEKGIETFYLLARDDKVDILKSVAKELLSTGNFILINNPKEFKNTKGNEVICYCIRINSDSIIAQTTQEISELIETKGKITGVITKVKSDGLRVDIDGIEGLVKKRNLSIVNIDDPRRYFKEDTYIELIPLEILPEGIIEFTLQGTNSDPNEIIQQDYQIGKSIFAKVEFSGDTFIILNIGHEQIKGIAFRKNLTYSRFIFLHEKYKIDEEHEFVIQSYDFEKNRIVLKIKDLKDPWSSLFFQKKSKHSFVPYKKTQKVFVGELGEGIDGILPFNELAWLKQDERKLKESLRINASVDCYIKEVDKVNRQVILTLKDESRNPYKEFLKNYEDEPLRFVVTEINDFGIHGVIDNKFNLFVPKYEQSWNGKKYDYHVGNFYKVVLKGVDKYPNRFIGSFKSIISHPLTEFQEKYKEGQSLTKLSFKSKNNWGCILEIKDRKHQYEGILFNGDISQGAFVNSSSSVFKNLDSLTVVIKSIDLEQNRIILSLKALTKKNHDRFETLDFAETLDGIVLGKKNGNYIVLIVGVWVEATLETDISYSIGDRIIVRPSAITEKEIFLTDD